MVLESRVYTTDFYVKKHAQKSVLFRLFALNLALFAELCFQIQ